MNFDDVIPTVETYRGIDLHADQAPERLDLVRRAIDAVFSEANVERLFEITSAPQWPPESRLLAAAKLEALLEIAADDHTERPAIDLARAQANVAGLDSRHWRDPDRYGSLLDGQGGVMRDQPLADEV